jgi:hypothetical protein
VLVVEDLECGDRPESFLLDHRCAEIHDLDQAGPVEGAGGSDLSVTRFP